MQFIGANLVNLEALNVHNDGHVTDDGLAALAGLTALTQLDLQGNVSITQVGQSVLVSVLLKTCLVRSIITTSESNAFTFFPC